MALIVHMGIPSDKTYHVVQDVIYRFDLRLRNYNIGQNQKR